MTALWAMSVKETRHILRDPQTLGMIILLPVLMLLMFGYALSADLRNAPIQVEVPGYDAQALRLAHQLGGGSLFEIQSIRPFYADADSAFASPDRPKAILRFPPHFSACVQMGSCQIQALIDGSDPNTAMLLSQALGPAVQLEMFKQLNLQHHDLIQVKSRFLFNPDQKSSMYFVPGLMATLLIMVCALLTSVTLVREKESGTMEQLRVSPMNPFALVLGKLSPYIAIAALIAAVILCLGYYAFGLVVKGSFGFLVVASLIYVFCALSIGLLISTLVSKQQQAMLIALGATMLPTIILSGFIFPIASMPAFLQYLSKLIPATWYLQIVRGVILQGTGLAQLWQAALVLLVMGAFLIVLAMLKLRRQIR